MCKHQNPFVPHEDQPLQTVHWDGDSRELFVAGLDVLTVRNPGDWTLDKTAASDQHVQSLCGSKFRILKPIFCFTFHGVPNGLRVTCVSSVKCLEQLIISDMFLQF